MRYMQNYAEEMLRLRETQLTEAYCQRQSLTESLEYLQTEKKRDQTQLESVIVELQSQLYVVLICSLFLHVFKV